MERVHYVSKKTDTLVRGIVVKKWGRKRVRRCGGKETRGGTGGCGVL